jgi:D-xylonolactonase
LRSPVTPGPTVQVALAAENIVGESAFWSVMTQQLFWVDGFASEIHSWNPISGHHRSVHVSSGPLGAIVGTQNPGVVGLIDREGIGLFDLDRQIRVALAHPEGHREGIGYNDAKVDFNGRLWVGTYDTGETDPRGCLWVLENGRMPQLAESGIAVVNGPTFSPDGRLMYLSDSMGRRILTFDVDHGSNPRRRRVLAQFSTEEGLPDGLTTDAEGCVWCAHWDGGCVTRFSPEGKRLAVIPLPTPRVTSLAFGGADFDTLFITTARYGLTDAQIGEAPCAGSLFCVKPGVRGVAAALLQMPFGNATCAISRG